MHRFYIDHKITGDTLTIHDSDQIKQMKKVLRLSEGDRIMLFDNTGFDYDCEIVKFEVKSTDLKVLKKIPGVGFNRNVTLYLALLKKDNFELVVQKATELGVSKIVPVLTHRCVKNSISPNQFDRYSSIIKEATEQSRGSIMPQLAKLQKYSETIDNLDENHLNLVAYEQEEVKHLNELNLENNINIFIGPEGGFTAEEIAYAQEKGCIVISLGKRILRAETAAIATLGRLLIT